jgi:hypothetical protein
LKIRNTYSQALRVHALKHENLGLRPWHHTIRV